MPSQDDDMFLDFEDSVTGEVVFGEKLNTEDEQNIRSELVCSACRSTRPISPLPG